MKKTNQYERESLSTKESLIILAAAILLAYTMDAILHNFLLSN